MPNILTVELVEQLQQAAEAGMPVETFIGALTDATLPGLLEYGCAKLHCRVLPELPPTIISSDVGLALSEIRSVIGLRANGDQKSPSGSMAPQKFEFIALEGENSTVNKDWDEYLLRFRQSAKSVGFSMNEAVALAASLGEMTDNATVHSKSPSILVGYQAIEGVALCCIVDVGIGVLDSLKSHEAYGNLSQHKDAIRIALQQGESCLGPKSGGGNGFNNVFKALAATWGTLRFRSGEGRVSMGWSRT